MAPRASLFVSAAALVVLAAAPATAVAGTGSSSGAIRQAITSRSTDGIVAELERAEGLLCNACIDLVRPLIDHEDSRVRDVAGWWLGRRGVRTEVIAAMRARLGTAAEDPIAARNAADVLGGMREISAIDDLTAYLSRPLDEESGRAAARAVGAIGHPKALPALVAAAAPSAASMMPGLAAEALSAMRGLRAPIGQRRAAEPATLLSALGATDSRVRREAAYTIGHLGQGAAGDPTVIAGLGERLRDDAAPEVRRAAAWALGALGDVAARAALDAARVDGDPRVRSVAGAALKRLR